MRRTRRRSGGSFMRCRPARLALCAGASVLLPVLGSFGIVNAASGASTPSTYVVLYRQPAVPSDVAASIKRAGGTLTFAYGAIGVAIASSSSSTFASSLAKDSRVGGVAATGGFGSALGDDGAT